MRLKTLIIGATTILLIVLGINSYIRINVKNMDTTAFENQSNTIITSDNLYKYIEFFNGADRKNFQHYFNIKNQFDESQFDNDTLKIYAYGYLYFSMWKMYSSLEKMVHSFQYNLYVSTENDNLFPGLPLSDFYLFSPTAKKYLKKEKNDYINSENNRFNYFLSIENIPPVSSQTTFHDLVSDIDNQNISYQDSTIFILNSEVIAMHKEKCFAVSKQLLTEYIQLTWEGAFSFKSKLLLTQLFGASRNLEKIQKIWGNSPHVEKVFQDSIAVYYLTSDILMSIPFINYTRIQKKIKPIHLTYTQFPQLDQLLEMLIDLYNLGQISLSSDDIISKYRLSVSESDDYIITPLYILYLSELLYKNGHLLDASKLISNFWFFDAKRHPPEYWWFENYPDYMIRSYTVGKWDGGRLQLWTSDYMDVIGNDPLLKMNYSVLELFNSVVFKDLEDPLHSN